jgi:predicted transcriptional regulator
MNKLLSIEQIERMDIEEVVSAYRNGYTLEEYEISAMTYTDLDSKSCISAVAVPVVSGAISGVVAITKCPTGSAFGTNVIVGATVQNTGTAHNNAFVLLCTVTRIDNAVVVASGNSGNLTLAPNETSAEFTVSFTMPISNVNVVFKAQADPAFNF